MRDKINQVAATQRRTEAKRENLLKKAVEIEAVLNAAFGDATLFGEGNNTTLEERGPDECAYGHLAYIGRELLVAFRTSDDDLEDAHYENESPSFLLRPPADVPRIWLQRLLTKDSLESLVDDIKARSEEQEDDVDRATAAVDSIVAAESARLDERMAGALEAFGSATLRENWSATLDAFHLNPADGTTRASSFVEAVCAEILRERGIPLPDNKSMKPLIETVLATLPWPEDEQLPADVKKLTSGVSTVCQAIGVLRTHYGSAHGVSAHLPPLDPAIAALAKNAGAAVAIFLLERHKNSSNQPLPEADP